MPGNWASSARGRCVVESLPLPVGVGGSGGSGCVFVLGPFHAGSGWGPLGYIRGKVCGAGPDLLRSPSRHSAPTALCRLRRGLYLEGGSVRERQYFAASELHQVSLSVLPLKRIRE